MARFKLTAGIKEADIQADILHSLGAEVFEIKPDKHGVLRRKGKGIFLGPLGAWWRANSGVFKGASGQPVRANPNGTADLLGVVNGRFVALEVKAESGKQSDDQRAWQMHIESVGGLYRVVKCVSEAIDFVRSVAA